SPSPRVQEGSTHEPLQERRGRVARGPVHPGARLGRQRFGCRPTRQGGGGPDQAQRQAWGLAHPAPARDAPPLHRPCPSAPHPHPRHPGAPRRSPPPPPTPPPPAAGPPGRRALFPPPRLSPNNTVACGSCHLQSRGFSEPRRFSQGFEGKPVDRNAMTLVDL